MRTAAVITAAGTGGRMGFPKILLAKPGNTPVLWELVKTLLNAGVHDVSCCIPPLSRCAVQEAQDISVLCNTAASHCCALLQSVDWDAGPIGSVWAALDQHPKVDALLILPMDAPFLDAGMVKRLLELGVQGHVARPEHEGRPGHPVVIPARLFPSLRACQGDGGVRAFLASHTIHAVPTLDTRVCANLDTPEAAASWNPPLVRWEP